jgi:hypothetical protein
MECPSLSLLYTPCLVKYIYRVPDTPGSLFSVNRRYTDMDMNISSEGKSQNSAVQNLCIFDEKKKPSNRWHWCRPLAG